MTRSTHCDSGDRRPIARDLHPMEVGNYRIGTPAIEAFYDLVKSCMDHKITGALIYGPSRIGKTRAIEYLRLAMAQNFAKVTRPITYRSSTSPSMPRGRSSRACWRPSAAPSRTKGVIRPSG